MAILSLPLPLVPEGAPSSARSIDQIHSEIPRAVLDARLSYEGEALR